MIDTQGVCEAPVDMGAKGDQSHTNDTLQHKDAVTHGDIFALASRSDAQPAGGQGGKTDDDAVVCWDSPRTRGDGSSSSDAEKEPVCSGFEGKDDSRGRSHRTSHPKSGCGSPAADERENAAFQRCYFLYDARQETPGVFDARAAPGTPPGGGERRFEAERERRSPGRPSLEPRPEGPKERGEPGSSEPGVTRKIPL